MLLTLAEILTITKGTLLAGRPEGCISGAIIDSRDARGGELFFPLQGEKENGHCFINDALRRGAAASLLEKDYITRFSPGDFPPEKALIVVDNCLQCLQEIAAYHRDKNFPAVVAVTGSNGKTTTKDLIASVLETRYCVLKTEGNYNNDIGLPLTLLRLRPQHEIAVLEMGMRGRGEIALLSALAKPGLGVITNIGEAHLELLGSRENISRAKGELLEAMGSRGTAVLNGDDPFLRRMGGLFPGRTVYYGYGERSDLRVQHSQFENGGYAFTAVLPQGGVAEFWVPLPGKHNVYNALAAVAVGLHFSLKESEIRKGLANASFSAMRMERMQTKSGFWLINDAYNASPSSMEFALQALKEWAGAELSIAVLGDMLELGAYTVEGHRKTGHCLARVGIDYLVTVGEQAAFIGEGAKEAGFPPGCMFSCSSNAEAIKVLQSLPLRGAHVLVKGSRAMGMETIVNEMLAKYN
ncbi:MAG: UDP-N-acetylmuramoyl-tripeptide--D-alanyl-D-alanine ligase [Bacillota bacterium]